MPIGVLSSYDGKSTQLAADRSTFHIHIFYHEIFIAFPPSFITLTTNEKIQAYGIFHA